MTDKETIQLESGVLGGTSKTREEYDKDAGECNLYRDVVSMFEESGHPNPEEWTHGRISEERLSSSPMSYQRLIVNRALRLELGKYTHDTKDQRYLLIDEGSYEDWKEYVKTAVAHIVKEDLANTDTAKE